MAYRFTPARRAQLRVARQIHIRRELARPNKTSNRTPNFKRMKRSAPAAPVQIPSVGAPSKNRYMKSSNAIGYWVAKGVNKTVGAIPGANFLLVSEKAQRRKMERWRR